MKPDDVVTYSSPRNKFQDTKTQNNDSCFHIAARNNDWEIFLAMRKHYSIDEFTKLMTHLRNDLQQDPIYPLLETFFSLQNKLKGIG